MSIVVYAYCDDDTERAIREIWSRLSAVGIVSEVARLGVRPHVSIAMAGGADERDIHRACASPDTPPPPRSIMFSSVGVFPGDAGVVFLAPVVTPELAMWHREMHARLLPALREPNPLYAPGAWVPHLTLALDLPPADIAKTVMVARDALPIRGTIAGWESIHMHDDRATV